MNILRFSGAAVGLMIGIILCVIIFKTSNKDHKLTTEYDERQTIIRNKAYKYAFYTLAAYNILLMILDLAQVELPASHYITGFFGIILGSLVLACYCIWKDVYWGLNNNRRRYAVSFIIIGLANLIPVVGAVKSGVSLFSDGFAAPVVNLMCVIMLLIIGVELLIKAAVSRNSDPEED